MYVLKSLFVLVCYGLSGVGFFLAWIGSILTLSHGGWYQVMVITWIAAAIAHVWLSLAWVEGRRLGKRTVFFASITGLLALMACPAALHFSGRELLDVTSVLRFVGMELLAVLPAFLLATYLTWYHLGASGRATS
jgi:hypothetical protein